MSRIFDALKNTNETDGVSVSSFLDSCHSQTVETADTQEAAILTEPIELAEEQQVPVVEAPAPTVHATPQIGIRRMPLRIGSPSPLLPFEDSQWYAGEQYRIIRTKILQHPMKPRTILVSSSGVGDGKSVSAVNIAGALSLKSESKVLLVEGDLRRPTIHSQLGLPRSPGLAEVLKGSASLESALIRTDQMPELYVLTAGEPTVNPAELLDSRRWRELNTDMRNMFGYVIIDSPPIGKVADYHLLQALSDAVVVVVRPDHTNRTLCLEALKIVSEEKLLGVVMNCTEDWFLARPYHYRADQYYSNRK